MNIPSLKDINVKIALAVVALIFVSMWGCPQYNVYRQRMDGQAKLAHAQYSKEVKVAEAKAEYEAGVWLAGKDTVRGHGIARTNEIIGQSLKNNESYLRWLWIDQLKDMQGQIMYIPTEANVPIMEAGRGLQPRYRKDTAQ